jgi:hypothetical protein
MKEYLMSSENVALYGECRAFLTCIKENHGGIFRLVVFSSLLDPEKKLKRLEQQELNAKTKNKGSHIFIRQDAISTNGKMVNFFFFLCDILILFSIVIYLMKLILEVRVNNYKHLERMMF